MGWQAQSWHAKNRRDPILMGSYAKAVKPQIVPLERRVAADRQVRTGSGIGTPFMA